MNYQKQFTHMFLAHLKMTFREKQAWFWGIFFPVILMVLFMFIFAGGTNREFQADIAVVDPSPNEASQMLLEQIRQLPVFTIESGEPVNREQAEQWIKDKKVDAALILPESAEAGAVQLIVNKENEQSAVTQAIAGIVEQFIQQANLAAAGVQPAYSLQFSAVTSGSGELEYRDFLLTGMIALAIAQSGLFGMSDMVEMRRKGLLKRLRMTPARMGLYGLSDMINRLVFCVIQIVLLSAIGVFGFGANVHIHLGGLIVLFLAGALAFAAMGYFISSFSKTMEAYMGVANIASFLMMFLSGVFIPVETLPEWLQPVADVLPLTYFVDGLRTTMVYASGFSSSYWLELGVLAGWGVITYIIGSFLYKSKSIAATR
jgi:ABC-2 type transport system permease protein